jgi:MFS transporter, FSR family, fosmidomycin resistance protein
MPIVTTAIGGDRDISVIASVSAAHYVSHVMQLALPSLFPFLHTVFGVGFTELGLVATLFYGASGLGQALVAGLLVDHYGAYRTLLWGITALSGGVTLAGLATSYWMFLPLALIAGLGNSVFHPAGLSMLSLRVRETRIGRAYAIHAILGALGYATSPLVVTTIATFANWRIGLILCGVAGFAVAAVLFANRSFLVCSPKRTEASPAGDAPQQGRYLGVLLSPVILMGFAYFALTSFSSQGVQTFGITSFSIGYGFSLRVAMLAVTAYLVGNAVGIVAGGVLADRTTRHHRVATSGMIVASAMMFLISAVHGSTEIVVSVMVVAGMAYGITQPSRDIIIRQTAPDGGLGSVFGFVYSGFDLGSATAPLLFGAILDHRAPHAVFLTIASALALAAFTVMRVRRHITPISLPAVGRGTAAQAEGKRR